MDMNFSLFLRFTPDRENIIHKNYNFYSTVTNLVLHWTCPHCLHEIKYVNNVGNTLQSHDCENFQLEKYPVLR